MRRGIGMFAAAGATLMALVPAAQADHHLVSISEVYPGSSASPDIEFIELQMYSAGQNLFAPAATIKTFNSAGTQSGTIGVATVPSGANQRHALIATEGAEVAFGVVADRDYANADLLSGTGGAVCLDSTSSSRIDCVGWGGVTLSDGATGTPEPAIPDGASIVRSTARGCATLLEAADDTDDSAADFFSLTPPFPEANLAAPDESTCPNTFFTRKPKRETSDRTPVFVIEEGPTFECKLDSNKFAECISPYQPGRLERGNHTLKARSTEGDGSIDPTPAKHTWKIVRKR